MHWYRGFRTAKSMIQWATHEYRKARQAYKVDCLTYREDAATVAVDIAKCQVWEQVLTYLTGDEYQVE